MNKLLKKTIILLCSALTVIGIVGCSTNKTVNSIKDYEKVYLSNSKDITYNSNSDLILNFGNDSQLWIKPDENDIEKIGRINLFISNEDAGTKEEKKYLKGLLKYIDSLNIETADNKKVSKKILEAKQSVKYEGDSKYDNDSVDIVDNGIYYIDYTSYYDGYSITIS